MSEFTAYNAATHPIIKLTEDWNELLDHGLVKPATYIVRVNGTDYEAIDGNTGKIFTSGANAATVIQATLNQIETLGGGSVLLKNGTYTLTAGLVKSPRVNIEGEGVATILSMGVGVADYAITVTTNYNVFYRSGTIQNLTIIGNAASSGGIHTIDTFNTKINNVVIKDFSVGSGIVLENSSYWTEGYIVSNVQIWSCLKGIRFLNSNGVDPLCTSFAYGYLGPYWIALDPVNGIGIELPYTCNATHTHIEGCVWIDDVTHTGYSINGECSWSTLNISCETFGGGTGINIGANAWMEACRWFEPHFTGSFTTEISNTTVKNLYTRHDQAVWHDDKVVINNDQDEGLTIYNSTLASNILNFNTHDYNFKLSNGGYFTIYDSGFTAAHIGFQATSSASGSNVFAHSFQTLTAVSGHAADPSGAIGTDTYPWPHVYATVIHGTDYMTGVLNGADQVVTILDGDTVHTHTLTFTSGLLTSYSYA